MRMVVARIKRALHQLALRWADPETQLTYTLEELAANVDRLNQAIQALEDERQTLEQQQYKLEKRLDKESPFDEEMKATVSEEVLDQYQTSRKLIEQRAAKLSDRIDLLEQRQANLEVKREILQEQVESLRIHKEALLAEMDAQSASNDVSRLLSGLNDEALQTQRAVDTLLEELESLRAEGDALTELQGDSLQLELDSQTNLEEPHAHRETELAMEG